MGSTKVTAIRSAEHPGASCYRPAPVAALSSPRVRCRGCSGEPWPGCERCAMSSAREEVCRQRARPALARRALGDGRTDQRGLGLGQDRRRSACAALTLTRRTPTNLSTDGGTRVRVALVPSKGNESASVHKLGGLRRPGQGYLAAELRPAARPRATPSGAEARLCVAADAYTLERYEATCSVCFARAAG